MLVRLNLAGVWLALIGAALFATPERASAISVEVAKKCNAPHRQGISAAQPGNPAAGSTKGSGVDQRAFFSKCVANNGDMEDKPAK